MGEDKGESPNQQKSIETIHDAVRLRPLMYFGTLDADALNQLIYTVLDHALDDAVDNTCNRIEVILHNGNTVSVRDNGQGLPLVTNPETGQRFDQVSPIEKSRDLKEYRIQASQHGLGLAIINAVCSSFNVEVKQSGFLWRQQFSEGQPLGELEQVRSLTVEEKTGTEITFTPDYSIFQPSEFDYTRLSWRLRELAYLLPGLTITLEDRRVGTTTRRLEFLSKDGASDFVLNLNRGYETLHQPITIRETIELERDYKPLGYSGTFDIALQYANVHQPVILSFMNGLEVEYGGPHIKGLIKALISTVIWSKDIGYHGFSEDDCLCGLAAVLSMQHPNPESCNSIY